MTAVFPPLPAPRCRRRILVVVFFFLQNLFYMCGVCNLFCQLLELSSSLPRERWQYSVTSLGIRVGMGAVQPRKIDEEISQGHRGCNYEISHVVKGQIDLSIIRAAKLPAIVIYILAILTA